jgi:hypothetical protein
MASSSQNPLAQTLQTLSQTLTKPTEEPRPLPTVLPGQVPLYQIPAPAAITALPHGNSGQFYQSPQSPQTSGTAESTTPQINNGQGADVKPLQDYLTAFFKSSHYQNLSNYERQRAVEYLNSTKVEPFFNSKGLKGPGIQFVNTLAAPYSTAPGAVDSTKPAPAGPGMQFIRGTEEGFAQGAAGVVKASIKYNPFAYAGTQIEKALFGHSRIEEGQNTMLDRLSIVRANISDFFDDNFGKPETLTGKVAKGAGEIAGQTPYWNKIMEGVKLVPWIGQAAEGQLLTRLKLLQIPGQNAQVVSESIAPLAQKAGASAIEGGAMALGTGEEPKTAEEWAAVGATMPVLGAAGSKLWTVLRGTRGAVGASALAQKGLKLAQTPAAQRPAVQSTDDAVVAAVAKAVDENGPKAAGQKIAAAMETLDSASAVDVAKEQFNATRQASPVAAKVNSAVSSIANAAGVKAPVEHAAQTAEESITKGTIGETLTPKDSTKLPSTLAGAKPRFKESNVEFESDIDKALYIIAQPIASKANGKYMDFLMKQFPDKTSTELIAMGRSIRSNIRGHADNLADGETVIQMPASNYAKSLKNQTVGDTVAETTNALDSQVIAVGKGDKAAVAWQIGKGPSGNIPNNLKMLTLKGQVIVFNPKAGLTADKIKAMVLDGRLNEVLGYPVSKETVAKAVAKGEKPVVVTAKDAVTDSEVQSTVASTSSAPATVEAVQAAHPTAKVEVQPAKVAGEINLERVRGELSHHYNNLIASEQGQAMAEALGKSHTAVNVADREAKISELAKQFIEQGGSKEELDKLMAGFELNRSAKIEAAKAFAAKAIAKKAAGQTVTPAIPNPEGVVKAASSKAEELKKQAAAAMEIINGAKATAEAPTTEPGTSMVDAVAEAEKKLRTSSKQVTATGATPEEIKAAKQTIRFELKDLGLDSKDDIYRRVLATFGFKKAEDIPPHLLNDVREALRAAKIKTSTFEEVDLGGQKAYEYQADGNGSVNLSPTKVFDASTGFNNEFVHEVSLKHPELMGGRSLGNVDAIDLFKDVVAKIGPDETNKLLTDMGYDAVSYGRPGHGERYLVEMLPGAKEATSQPIEEAKKLADAATNTGIRDEQVGTSAVDAAVRAKAILDGLKKAKKVNPKDALKTGLAVVGAATLVLPAVNMTKTSKADTEFKSSDGTQPEFDVNDTRVTQLSTENYHGEKLDNRLKEFLTEAKQAGVKLRLAEVDRKDSLQQKYYDQGRTTPGPIITNAQPGQSLHSESRHRAFDVDIIDSHGNVSNKASDYTKLADIAAKLGLVWGGNFKSLKGDLRHFELPSIVKPGKTVGVPIPKGLYRGE